MTLNELLYESLKGDEHFLAYSIFWAMQKGLVVGTDNFDKFKNADLNIEEIKALQELNPLGVKQINLYSMNISATEYLFVFAGTPIEARGLFHSTVGRFPEKVVDASSRMDTTMWDEQEGYQTFRQMKDKTMAFPSVALLYRVDDRPVEQVEYDYYKVFGKQVRKLKG